MASSEMQQVPHIRSEHIYEFCKMVVGSAKELSLDAENLYQGFVPLMLQFDDEDAKLEMDCLHGVSQCCWLITHIERWNDLINPFGAELVQVSEKNVWLRTLQLEVKKPENANDFTAALCLLMWLITQHRCIVRVTLLVDVLSPPSAYPLYNGLTLHIGYLSLSIQISDKILDPRTSEMFLSKTWYLHRLESLQLCGVRVSGRHAAHLDSLFKDNRSLKEFVLTSVVDEAEMPTRLFPALSKHKSLKKLKLHLILEVAPSVCELFIGNPLKMSQLKEYSVEINCSHREIYKELARNNSLTTLTVTTSVTTPACLSTLARSMAKNTGLKSLKILMEGSPSALHGHDSRFLADVIEKNTALEELTLKHHGFPEIFARQVSAALAKNETLKRLEIAGDNVTPDYLSCFNDILKRNRTIQHINLGVIGGISESLFRKISVNKELARLHFHYTDDVILLLTALPGAGPLLSELDVNSSNADMAVIADLCDALLSSASILTTFSMTVSGAVNMSTATSLHLLFAVGETLRNVVVRCTTTGKISKHVIEGLEKSKTIRSFEMDGWCLDDAAVGALVHMLQENKIITHLAVRQSLLAEIQVLDSRIKEGVDLNVILVSFDVFVGEAGTRFINASILRALRRNQRLVNLVTESIIKNAVSGCRADLQLIQSSNALIVRLEERAGYSRDEARDKVHSALHAITSPPVS